MSPVTTTFASNSYIFGMRVKLHNQEHFSHVELCEILGFRGVWCVHNPCHLGMGILYQSRRASNVVTTHVKYGDQGIYYSWLDN